MNITNFKEKSVGAMVAEDYRTASVFKKYGIDFCCKGNRTLEEVCDNKNVSYDELVSSLNELNKIETTTPEFDTWPLDLLIDYIEKKHHRYVESTTEVLTQYLDKVCKVHGHHHTELLEIRDHFAETASNLAMHMKKEELILFPYVKKIVNAQSTNTRLEKAQFGSVLNPINVMREEHEAEGDRFRSIAHLSSNYTPPEEACNTYRVTYALLQEFENDLHMHIHLENNILFPKALEMESKLI